MALEYPSNIAELLTLGATFILFTFFKRPSSTSSDIDNALGHSVIIMPVPKNLENPMDIAWEQTELGGIGNSIMSGTSNSFDGEGTILNALEGLGAKVTSLTGFDEGKAKAIIGAKQGNIANPYIAMTFKSIGFRKYKMEFRFTPHNVQECKTIDLIVKKFRKSALPYDNGARIGYPGEIGIMYVTSREYWLPKFKRSVITNVQVSYSGQGHYAQMDNGFPAETVLNIEFSENELVWRKDITSGYSF